MNLDATRVPKNSIGSLDSCLIEGDPLQQRRARSVRRRAIFFSVAFQTIALAAFLIFPLLGKGEHLSTNIVVPVPPYRLGSAIPVGERVARTHKPRTTSTFFYSNLANTFHKPSLPGGDQPGVGTALIPGIEGGPIGDPKGVLNGIDLPGRTPPPPATVDHSSIPKHQRVTITHIDPAHITRRVEPIYPVLGIQLRRETRVELHAIISTDGSIQSLQIISGDPIFYQSALNAVNQWHYTPTLLNDQPVEVDTYITVIYSLNR